VPLFGDTVSRPRLVMVVDHEDMRMFDATMAMGMPMRFVALGSVMAVIVVLVVDVFVFVIEFIVHMRQRFVVSRRPQPRRYEGEEKDIRRQNQCRHLNADSRPEVARHRIQYEPARMGQGELGRKVGWTIPGRCRTIDESPRWRGPARDAAAALAAQPSGHPTRRAPWAPRCPAPSRAPALLEPSRVPRPPTRPS